MLLKLKNQDNAFKKEITKYVTHNRIRFGDLQNYISKDHSFVRFGNPFKSFGKKKFRQSREQLSRYSQLASGCDASALYLLSYILNLHKFLDRNGDIQYAELPANAKSAFVRALEFAYELYPSKFDIKTIVRMEVDAVCSGASPVIRLGRKSINRLGDFLINGPDSLRESALDQLDRLHSVEIDAYDDCYPALIFAQTATKSNIIRKNIIISKKIIEQRNPAATMPVVVRSIIFAIQAGGRAVKEFNSKVRNRGFTDEQICIIALGISDQLYDMGNREPAIDILSESAKYAGSNSKLLAWIGLSLRDTLGAARALFDYAYELKSENMFFNIERHHAIEAACRLLFKGDTILFEKEIGCQIRRFRYSKDLSIINKLREWKASGKGFGSYLQERIAQIKTAKFDKPEVRISQRIIAERHFLLGIEKRFKMHFIEGLRWFEKASLGNDAPWIIGERHLLQGIKGSLDSFNSHNRKKNSVADVKAIEQNFVKASDLLNSPYPLALSLTFRALVDSCSAITADNIKDLTLAIEMLPPDTPEVLEMRNHVEHARWLLIHFLSNQNNVDIKSVKNIWVKIVSLAPLLYSVIDKGDRLKQHFSPTRELYRYSLMSITLMDVITVKDSHERGRLLETYVKEMIDASRGLRVVDVRRRNNFEEIDIIVSLNQNNPLLSYWGPLILVECKNWSKKVGTDPVRSFYTKMITKKGAARLGIIISPSGFTKGVKELSRLFQDGLVISIGPNELSRVESREISFITLLEQLIPSALFA